MKTQISNKGIITLTDSAVESRKDSPLWNDDLRPTTMEEHNWTKYNYATLWIGMCLCIPTYMMAIGLIQAGMNVIQAMITMILGNIIILVVILLNSHAGAKYGIPYAVFARLWFGSKGAHIPTVVRGLIAAGWFGFNCWVGAQAIDACITAFAPGWANVGSHLYIVFGAFWLLNIGVAVYGPQAMRKLSAFAGPALGVAAIALFIWAVVTIQKTPEGIGQIFTHKSSFVDGSAFLKAFFLGLVSVIAFWATLALNIPDFCRYAKSQKDHAVAQSIALPVTMAVFSFIAITTTSAAIVINGYSLSDPVALATYSSPVAMIVQFPPVVVFIGALIVTLSALTINVNANLVAPARTIENFAPRKLTFAHGAIGTGIIALLMQPWSLAEHLLVWLSTYGAFLAPIDGIAVADYWMVRKRRMNLIELYNPDKGGLYNYSGGFNMSAVITYVACSLILVLILVIAPTSMLWSLNWFIGTILSLIIYTLLMKNNKSLISVETFEKITDFKI